MFFGGLVLLEGKGRMFLVIVRIWKKEGVKREVNNRYIIIKLLYIYNKRIGWNIDIRELIIF